MNIKNRDFWRTVLFFILLPFNFLWIILYCIWIVIKYVWDNTFGAIGEEIYNRRRSKDYYRNKPHKKEKINQKKENELDPWRIR